MQIKTKSFHKPLKVCHIEIRVHLTKLLAFKASLDNQTNDVQIAGGGTESWLFHIGSNYLWLV